MAASTRTCRRATETNKTNRDPQHCTKNTLPQVKSLNQWRPRMRLALSCVTKNRICVGTFRDPSVKKGSFRAVGFFFFGNSAEVCTPVFGSPPQQDSCRHHRFVCAFFLFFLPPTNFFQWAPVPMGGYELRTPCPRKRETTSWPWCCVIDRPICVGTGARWWSFALRSM